jgi:alcohol dehydrogenase (NADP+)
MKQEVCKLKLFKETDIDIRISHRGVCSNSMSHLRSGWKQADHPIVIRYEMIDHVVEVGSAIQGTYLNYRIGVGVQGKVCLSCDRCAKDKEQHCKNDMIVTYNACCTDLSKVYGGYSKYRRGPADSAFLIPEALPSEVAAPMLCGGLIVFAPSSTTVPAREGELVL